MNKHNPPGSIKKTVSYVAKRPVLSLVLTFLCVLTCFKLIDYAASRYSCHARWVDSSIESKYTLRGGCLIQYKGTWIPEGNFRIN